MSVAKVGSDLVVRRLDRPAEPDEILTEKDVTDPKELVKALNQLRKDTTQLMRRANPSRVDFEDVTVGTSGSTIRLAHHLGTRARWTVLGWQADTPGALWDHAALWSRRAFFGPGTLATTAGDFTTGCRFQCSVRTRIAGARFAWFTSGATRTVTAKLWRDGDGSLLASGTVSVTNSGCYVASFAQPALIQGSDLNVDLTVSIYDGGHNYSSTGADAAFTGLLPLTLPGLLLKAVDKYAAGDARPTSNAATERYWVEPYVSPPWPGLVEDTTATDSNTLVLLSYVPGVVSIRCEAQA